MTPIAESSATLLHESNAEYHARSAIGNSMLSTFLSSPRLFEAKHVLGQLVDEDRETNALDVGTGTHTWCFEPESFESHIAVVPAEVLDKAGKRNGNAYREWEAKQNGKAILNEKEWDRVRAMRRALHAHPVAGELIRSATEREQTILWQCSYSGLERKIRMDLATSYLKRRLIADLKTSSDHTPEGFSKSMARYGYHRQAAFYREGWHAAHGEWLDYVLIVVSSKPPHVVRVYHLDDNTVQKGREQVCDGLMRLAECYRTGDWSEPGEKIIAELSLPRWAFYED